jgi:hypothetical protein
MAVPYTFATATSSIPLSQLDSNFATGITLGNTTVYLGNTTTSIGNLTLTNTTISSVAVTFPNSYLANSSITLGTTNVSLGGTATTLANLTLSNVTISSTSTPLTVPQGGTGLTTLTAGYIPYGNGTSAFGSSANLFWDNTNAALGVGVTNPNTYGKLVVSGGNMSVLAGGILRAYRTDNATYNEIKYVTSGDLFYLNQANGGAYQFNISGTEYMRLTSAGNLGIGTSSPSALLHTYGTTGTISNYIENTSASGYTELTLKNTGSSGHIYSIGVGGNSASTGYANNLYFYDGTNSAIRMTLDLSGNLGLGVTPSAWGSSRKAIQAGVGASLQGSTGTYGFAEFGANFYYNGTSDIYLASDYASKYRQISGQHQFYVAPSSTGTISFTQAMTLDNSGNLLVGTTSSSYGTSGRGLIEINGSSTALLGLKVGGTQIGYIASASSNIEIGGSQSSVYIDFVTNGAERARIDTSGNLLVGTTSAGVGYASQGIILEPSGYESVNHASGTSSGSAYIAFGYNSAGIGSITQNGTTGVLYNLTSDYRLKNNPTALTGASEFIMALQPKTWDWWDGSGKGVGFIAHEFMEVAKYSGNGTKDEVDAEGNPVYQSIQPSSSEVMANLVALVQEQQAIIEQLKQKVGI